MAIVANRAKVYLLQVCCSARVADCGSLSLIPVSFPP